MEGWKQKQETEIETKNFQNVPQNWPKQPPPRFCFSKMFQKQKQKQISKGGGWQFEKILGKILFLSVSVSNSYEVF